VASCDSGYADCDDDAGNGCEVHTDSDVENCGACGNACPDPDHGSATCSGGVCGVTCDAGYVSCDGACKRGPIQTCLSDEECCSGACDQGYCLAAPLGFGAICDSAADCASGVCCRNVCTDPASFATSPINCGGCGNFCNTLACFDSECVTCNPGATRPCYEGTLSTRNVGVCKDGVQTCAADGSGWGECVGQVLPGTEICDGLDNDCDGVIDNGNPGGGVPCYTGLLGVCAAGTTVCSNGELLCNQNMQPSPEICDGLDNNCDGVVDGGAAASCPPRNHMTPACTGGECTYTCNAGYGNCDGNPDNGCETDLNFDVNNCGACGHKCNSTNGSAYCYYGQCQIQCAAGYGDCDSPSNGCETDLSTPENCGSCFRNCSSMGAGNVTCEDNYRCCGDTNGGHICCDEPYRPYAYWYEQCSTYCCGGFYSDCHSCGPFGKDTCCGTAYCHGYCWQGCYVAGCF
jgi:hypothetical protein